MTALNETQILEVCGANFLPSTHARKALQPQSPEKIQMLVGIFLACMAAASLIVAIGVDSMKRYDNEHNRSGLSPSAMTLLAATLKLQMDPNQLMLIVINVFIGLQQAFFGADFTAAFVSCVIGTGNIGFVMITFGIANAVGCIVTGYISKVGKYTEPGRVLAVTGRFPLICMAVILQAGLLVSILTWKPHPGDAYLLYVIAVLWGLCDSVWIIQINAYYGVLFPGREEAAFSSYRLWESFGYIIAYVMSPYLRAEAKIYLLIAMMTVGTTCYFVVEYMDRRKKKLQEKNYAELTKVQ
ncbi:unnamed protein product, partial [Iphiclides podalirius]